MMAPSRPIPPPKDENIALLKLSTQWAMDEVGWSHDIHDLQVSSSTTLNQIRGLAIDRLSRAELDTIEKILLAKQFKISEWLVEGYTSLIQSWDSISLEKMADSLGWEAVARLMDLVLKSKPTGLDLAPVSGWSTSTCSHTLGRSSLSISPHTSTGSRSVTCNRCSFALASFSLSGAQLTSDKLPDAIKAAFKVEFDSM
jgi:hypothetical protein